MIALTASACAMLSCVGEPDALLPVVAGAELVARPGESVSEWIPE
jgi:hypothetical protein